MQKIITIFQCFTCSNIAIDALMRQSKLTEVEKKKKIYIERPKITLIGRVKQNMLITEVIKNIILNKIK